MEKNIDYDVKLLKFIQWFVHDAEVILNFILEKVNVNIVEQILQLNFL